MGVLSTVYDVKVQYRSNAAQESKGVEKFAGTLDRAGKSSDRLKTSLLGIGGAVAGFAAIHAGKKAFIDFNSSVEQSTISIALQQRMLTGGSWAAAMRSASQQFTFYQDVAKKSVGATEDFISMHKELAGTAYRFGFDTGELQKLVVGATVLSQALGERSEMVALDIKQMLAGDVTSRDRTAQFLLASQGLDSKKFNAMSAQKRVGVVTKALTDPSIAAATKEMENSFAGVTSTLKDNLQIALGKIGLPLFKAITNEVKRWNDWIDKHPQKIQQFATTFSNALVTGFNAVKRVGEFIVEHGALLMDIAKVWLVAKGASMAGGLAKGLGASLGGAIAGLMPAAAGAGAPQLDPKVMYGGLARYGKQVDATTSTMGKLITATGSAANALLRFAPVLGGIYIAAEGLANWIDRKQQDDINKSADRGVILAAYQRQQNLVPWVNQTTHTFEKEAMTSGAVGGGKKSANFAAAEAAMVSQQNAYFGESISLLQAAADAGSTYVDSLGAVQVNTEKFAGALRSMGLDAQSATSIVTATTEALARMQDPAYGLQDPESIYRYTRTKAPGAAEDSGKKVIPPQIGPITVKMEVKSDDPDRISFALIDVLEDVARNPTQARRRRGR